MIDIEEFINNQMKQFGEEINSSGDWEEGYNAGYLACLEEIKEKFFAEIEE